MNCSTALISLQPSSLGSDLWSIVEIFTWFEFLLGMILSRVSLSCRDACHYLVEHLASTASFISFCLSSYYTEKEALHKSALSFEVAVAPILGLVIPVYRGQTVFSSASINFYEKPMVKTEPTRKRDALLRVVSNFENVHDLSKQQSAAIKSFASGTDTFVSLPTGHGKSLLYQLAIPLTKALRKHSEPSVRCCYVCHLQLR